jgi:hypothetical protein
VSDGLGTVRRIFDGTPCPKCKQPLEAHGSGLGQISPQGCRMVELQNDLQGKIVATPAAILTAIEDEHRAQGKGHLFSYSIVSAALRKLT